MKEFLSREGYTFEARDVDEDHAAYSDLIALGLRTVPVTVIGSRIVKGFEQGQLRSALSAAADEP